MSGPSTHATFSGLVDLLAGTLGGRALACSDDFFASMHNLVKAGAAHWDPDRYTARGKWMDGWESRRRRDDGHDWCVLALGAPGQIRALDIDTSHFLGNHPPFASFEAAETTDEAWAEAEWVPLLAPSPLRPGSQNLFTVASDRRFTHVRLRMLPDGGVARLRVYGVVDSDFSPRALDEETAAHVAADRIDLCALGHGAKALACSDAFFGPMDNLLLPTRAENMGGGWETRRKRPAPGHDWILVRLAAAGRIEALEIDTNHFKGNFPDRCAVFGVHRPEATVTELVGSDEFVELLPATSLRAHERRFFTGEALASGGPFTHLRLDIFPDGGVSRLRAWGQRA